MIVEEPTRLRSPDDGGHINIRELEGVGRTINMVIKWKHSNFTALPDSATAFDSVKSVSNDNKRPKVSRLSEIIDKRHLGLISKLIEDHGLVLEISPVNL